MHRSLYQPHLSNHPKLKSLVFSAMPLQYRDAVFVHRTHCYRLVRSSYYIYSGTPVRNRLPEPIYKLFVPLRRLHVRFPNGYFHKLSLRKEHFSVIPWKPDLAAPPNYILGHQFHLLLHFHLSHRKVLESSEQMLILHFRFHR